MTNHYHVVVATVDANLSKGRRQINGVYTQQCNRRHGLVGHLFQGRFTAILVERDAYQLELSRYVVLNPVRAAMVPDAAAWPWNSYRAMVGLRIAPTWLETDWVPGQFGADLPKAQARYAAFVGEGMDRPSIWQALRHQMFLGSEAFVERFAQASRPLDPLREIPRAASPPRAAAPPLRGDLSFAPRSDGTRFPTGV